MVKRIVGYQIQTSICIKCCLRQVFNDFAEFTFKKLALRQLHAFKKLHHSFKIIFINCIFICSQEPSFIQPMSSLLYQVCFIRVFRQHWDVIPISPSKKHSGIYCFGRIFLFQEQFDLCTFLWNEQMIILEAGIEDKIKISYIYVIIIQRCLRISNKIFIITAPLFLAH